MPVTAENKEFSQLAQLVPLNTLGDEALKSLLEQVDIEVINKGQLIFKEGDVDNANIYLLTGRIGLFNGDNQVDLVEDSAATARFPVAHQVPRQFTAKALAKSDIVRIDSRLLSEALAKNESGGLQVEDEIEEDDDADWMTQLLQSRVMQNIPAANLQGVMMRMQEFPVSAEDYVIREGEEGDFYYLLHRGHAVVFTKDDDGNDVELAKLGPGASFGEDALLSNMPRTSSVKMLTDGVLLKLAKDDFIELIKHPLSDTVDYDQACAVVEDGGLWLDVRSPEAYEKGHLPGSINMPFATLRYQLPSLHPEIHYIVYSQTGTRAVASAFLFMENGLNASILEGGYESVLQTEAAENEVAPEASAVSDESVAAKAAEVSSDEANQLRQEIESLKQQLEQAKAEGGSGEGVSDNEEIERLKKENIKLEREIISLTGQLESEEDVYDKLKQQYDALSAENKKHLQVRDQDIASLKEELTVLQLERDELESDLDELKAGQSGGGTDADAADVQEKLQQAQNQVSQLEALNASITEDRDKHRFDLEEARNQLSLANQENSELQLEIADLKDRLAEQNSAQSSTD